MTRKFFARLVISLIVVLLLGFVFARRRRPILFQILAETGCACGEYHENVTGWIVLNPFRDRSPERSAANFLEDLRNGRCTAESTLCQYALNGHRVSEWRLANLRDTGQSVQLYYKLTAFGVDAARFRFSGEGLVEVTRVQNGWKVSCYSSYF